jgi:hypothetical protein
MNILLKKHKEIFLCLIIIVYLVSRYYLVSSRYYDHDELEHLNATWSLAKGQLPYLDFFEHHFPWLYHSSSFIFSIFNKVETNTDQAIGSILFARIYMQAFFLLSSFFLYRAVRLMHSHIVSLLVLTLYLSSTPLLSKTIEFRGDVPALMFFTLTIYLLLSAFKNAQNRNFYLSCLSYGIAVMFTQKYLVILPGFLMCSVYYFFKIQKQRGGALIFILLSSTILASPFLVTALYYTAHGALTNFVYYNLIIHSNWANESHWYHTEKFIKSAIIPLALAFISIMVITVQSIQNKSITASHTVFGIFFIWFVIALYLIPISALQFYIIFIPSMCYFSSIALDKIYRKINFIPVAIILTILIISDSTLKRTFDHYRMKQDYTISYITKNTKATDIAFVGHPNYAIYRPSISFYQFIHREIWLTMSEEEKEKINHIVRSDHNRPQIISYDYNLRTFFKDLKSEIKNNYTVVPGTTTSKGHIYEYALLIVKEKSQTNSK